MTRHIPWLRVLVERMVIVGSVLLALVPWHRSHAAKPWIMRLVTGLFRPKRPIPGTYFAGVVEAVGEHTHALKAGDAVFGFDDVGLCSHAEYMTFSEDDAVAIKPSDVSLAEAAESIEGAHHARNFTTAGPVSSC